MGRYFTYLKAAALNQINIVLFGGLGLVSLISGNPIPFAVAVAGELTWLGIAPLIPPFRNAVDSGTRRLLRERQMEERREALSELSDSSRRRFKTLQDIVKTIQENNARNTDVTVPLVEQITVRLDEMLQRYLTTLRLSAKYDDYIAEVDREHLDQKLEALQTELETADARLSDVKRQRVDILSKRIEKFRKATDDALLLRSQLETFEDLVKLFREQSITFRDPAEMTSQLDSLITEMEVSEQTIAELESSFSVIFDRELLREEEKLLKQAG